MTWLSCGLHGGNLTHQCIKTTRGPWTTMLTRVNSYKSLIQHFRLSVAMATNQNEEFVQLYIWCRTTEQTFIKKLLSKYVQRDNNKELSLFSICQWKVLSCHCNESTQAMAIKNTIFVEANVTNISAVSASYPLWLLRRWFFNIFLANLSNSDDWTKFLCLVKDYSRNISVKLLSKYLQWDSNKGLLSFFPLQVNGNF